METEMLVATSTLPDLKYKFSHLNPFQSQFYNTYNHVDNAVVSAPTGSGKSIIAEIAINEALAKGKRAIYIAPMRSLVREKFDDWTNQEHPFSEYGVSIMTGDYKLTAAKKKELLVNKLIAMTSEMLDSRSRRMKIEGNKWLLETDVLIIDEAHIIGMWNEGQEPLQERGHKLEAALMRFSKINPEARIILLSATLPNLPELGQWLSKLNNKQTKIIVSDYRPQPVEWHLEIFKEVWGTGSYYANKARMRELGIQLIKEYPEDMWLVFCHSKIDGRAFQKDLSNELGVQIPFHCADLDAEERVNIETNFRTKEYKIILATSTLAYGVNLPARRVMILDDKRGLNKVHPYDIKQMGGRAGRPGIDPRGDVHWIIGDGDEESAQQNINSIPPAKSLMFDLDTFCFHIVAEIAEGGINDLPGVTEFFNRCLACHQGAQVTNEWLMKLVDKLVECKAIKKTDDNLLAATSLGRIASWLYFSPFDVYNWSTNLRTVVESKRKDDAILAWCWASIRGNSMNYIPKDAKGICAELENELRGIGPTRGCLPAIAGLWLRLQNREKELPDSLRAITRNLTFDIDRHAQALTLIDSMWGKWKKSDGLKLLAIRMKYMVDWDTAKLCLLPGIGKIKGEKLVKAGIKSVGDMIERKDECVKLIGSATYIKAIGEENG